MAAIIAALICGHAARSSPRTRDEYVPLPTPGAPKKIKFWGPGGRPDAVVVAAPRAPRRAAAAPSRSAPNDAAITATPARARDRARPR